MNNCIILYINFMTGLYHYLLCSIFLPLFLRSIIIIMKGLGNPKMRWRYHQLLLTPSDNCVITISRNTQSFHISFGVSLGRLPVGASHITFRDPLFSSPSYFIHRNIYHLKYVYRIWFA